MNASVTTNQYELVIESGASLVSDKIMIAILRPYSNGTRSTSTRLQRQLLDKALSAYRTMRLKTELASTQA